MGGMWAALYIKCCTLRREGVTGEVKEAIATTSVTVGVHGLSTLPLCFPLGLSLYWWPQARHIGHVHRDRD